MKTFCFFICTLLFTLPAASQTPVDSIKKAIGNLFDAMRMGDSTALMSCFAESAVLQTAVRTPDGAVSVKNEQIVEFGRQIASIPKGDADERITFDVVKVDGDLAIAWTPYRFFFKGKFSHCGVNSFQMVRLKGEWKIQYIIDTRRKDHCL
jgi:ketosteroid isomerase-like protein